MTTYAWDGESLSADTRVTDSESLKTYDDRTRKCYLAFDKNNRAYFITGSGGLTVLRGAITEVFKSRSRYWPSFSSEFKEKVVNQESFSRTRITIVRLLQKDCMDYSSLNPELYTPPGCIHSGGIGEDIALGAMAAGKSSREAIEITCKYNAATGGEIHTMHSSLYGSKENAISILKDNGLYITEDD